jgi:hypothetical protein
MGHQLRPQRQNNQIRATARVPDLDLDMAQIGGYL